MKEMALRCVASEMLEKLAKEDKRIMVFTSDATGSASLNHFAESCPEQLVEMGIAEQNEVTVAAGISSCDFKPFVCAPAAFMTARALEQVKIDVAYCDCNVKIIGISGGISYGTTGATHHAINDLAVTVPMENMQVLLPADGVQMAWLMSYLVKKEGPCYVRVGRNPVPVIYKEGTTFQIGRAVKIKEGGDLTICAAGEILYHAIEAAELLEKQGIHARVLDMFSVKPMDTEAVICAAKETKRILVAEEHTVCGGIGSLICQITAKYCPVPVKCLGLPSEHIVSGNSAEVFSWYGLDAAGIAKSAGALLGERVRSA